MEEKVKIIKELLVCGYKQMEVTTFVHPRAIPQLQDASTVLQRIKKKQRCEITGIGAKLPWIRKSH